MTVDTSLIQRPAWLTLQAHYHEMKDVHLRTLFNQDPKRGERMTCEVAGLYLDYSKNRVTDETIRLLLQLAAECDLRGKIDAMFRGDKINITENAPSSTRRCAPRARGDLGGWRQRRA